MDKIKIPELPSRILMGQVTLILNSSAVLCGIAFMDENDLCVYAPEGLNVYTTELEFLDEYKGCTLISGTFDEFSKLCGQLLMTLVK